MRKIIIIIIDMLKKYLGGEEKGGEKWWGVGARPPEEFFVCTSHRVFIDLEATLTMGHSRGTWPFPTFLHCSLTTLHHGPIASDPTSTCRRFQIFFFFDVVIKLKLLFIIITFLFIIFKKSNSRLNFLNIIIYIPQYYNKTH